jgi:4-hydroxybenzoate polyprenyltransferase
MKLFVYLRLGRVSNLPTVWTNVLAGATLAGVRASACTLVALCAIVSAFYVGGMFLNDAFDRDLDARERPTRPIPAGLITAREVFTIGFSLLGLGIAALAYGFGARAGGGGAARAATIVLYAAWHKGNPISPGIMGACRALVYAIAALAVTGYLPRPALFGALALWSYLIGLTYIAKQETLLEPKNLWPAMFVFPVFYGMHFGALSIALHLLFFLWILGTLPYLLRRQPGDVPTAVLRLLAGICLLDATVLADRPLLVAVALACFALTRRLHRSIPGT